LFDENHHHDDEVVSGESIAAGLGGADEEGELNVENRFRVSTEDLDGGILAKGGSLGSVRDVTDAVGSEDLVKCCTRGGGRDSTRFGEKEGGRWTGAGRDMHGSCNASSRALSAGDGG
jgi:hypothetical protein